MSEDSVCWLQNKNKQIINQSEISKQIKIKLHIWVNIELAFPLVFSCPYLTACPNNQYVSNLLKGPLMTSNFVYSVKFCTEFDLFYYSFTPSMSVVSF